MKKHNDYTAGPHHYWIFFVCGLVFGIGMGFLVGWNLFNRGWPVGLTTFGMAAGFAYCSGRWGDRAWHRMIWLLSWLVP